MARHLLQGGDHFVHSIDGRSEEHTSELQSHSDLVCRLLLEKKNSAILNPANIIHLEEETAFKYIKQITVAVTKVRGVV